MYFTKDVSINRRHFLKLAGGTATTLAMLSILNGCVPVESVGSSSSAPIKIGVMLPYSGNFAVYGNGIEAGMRLYLEDELGSEIAGRPIELVAEDTEGNPQTGLQKAIKLVEQDEVDIVTGVVSSAVLMAARDYFHENQKLFVCANAGANAISRGLKSPYIWRTSYSNWMLSARMGTWTAENVGKKAALVVADYAAGHNDRDSFTYHYTEAGGTIAKIILVPFPAMGDPAPIIADIANIDADFMYLFLPGGAGVSFFKSATQFGLFDQIPLYAGNAQVAEEILPALGDSAEGLINSWFWSYTLDNSENEALISAYISKYNSTPGTFVVQGHDSARVIATMLERVEGDTTDVNKMIEAMAGIRFDSPRGPFVLDEATQNPRHNWYLQEVARHSDGLLHNTFIENLGEIVDPGDDSKG